ncbi:MAG: thioredoxin family protein [Bacillota bacterium]
MKKWMTIFVLIGVFILAGGIFGYRLYQGNRTPLESDKFEPENHRSEEKMNSSSNATGKNLPSLVDLGAGFCFPCKQMEPILKELKAEYKGKIDIRIIDVYEQRPEAMKYGIRVIPTQIFFDKEGKEVFRHEGFIPKADIIARFKQYGMIE